MYLRHHSTILRVGEKRIVTPSKWTVLAISLLFTLGYVVEHSYLNTASMPWYIYFKSLRSVRGIHLNPEISNRHYYY